MPIESGLERGMVRSSRANLVLRNRLSLRTAWLADLAGDAALPRIGLLPAGRPVEFRWRMIFSGRQGALLQLGLPDAFLESVGAARGTRAGLVQALAAHHAEPLMPMLRTLFGQDIDVRVEAAPHGWPEAADWSKFQICIGSLEHRLPARMIDAFALELSRRLGVRAPRAVADIPVQVTAGARCLVPASALRHLGEGDVLLGDETTGPGDEEVRLFVQGADAGRADRWIASVRRLDGRVVHLRPAVAHGPARDPGGGPWVALDVVEASLQLTAKRCRMLAIGQRMPHWEDVVWCDEAAVRWGATCLGFARKIRIAGRVAFEIVRLGRSHRASFALTPPASRT